MELDLPRREFSSPLTNVDDFTMFITQGEIDKELAGKDAVHRYSLEDSWYKFRNEALKNCGLVYMI